MKKAEEYTRLVSQTYESIVNDYVAMTQRAEAAEARVKELEVSLAAIGEIAVSNWDDSTVGKVDEILDEPVRYADILRSLFKSADRVKELEEDNARGAAYVQHLKEQLAARQQGGDK